jgi:hypothetical protein
VNTEESNDENAHKGSPVLLKLPLRTVKPEGQAGSQHPAIKQKSTAAWHAFAEPQSCITEN